MARSARIARAARVAVVVALAHAPWLASAQGEPAPSFERKAALVRVGYETLALPGSEQLGLLGTRYLLELRPGLCVGPGVYSAASGERGGLFVVGAEAALCVDLVGPLSLRTGVFVGGGGGGAAPVGSGLMLRPHADLMWSFGNWRAGVSVSHVNFPSGQIDSTQFGAVFEIDTDFSFAPRSAGTDRPRDASGKGNGIGIGIGVDRFAVVGGAYFPASSVLGNSAQPLQSRIGTVGARVDHFITPSLYAGLESNAAASGGAAGYAEFLGTLGVRSGSAQDWLTLGARVALGMAGGGDMPVGGGLFAKAGVDAAWRLSRDLSLALEAGWATAPQGSFRAPYGALSLHWTLAPEPGEPTAVALQEFAGGIETWQDVVRQVGPPRSLQNISFKFNRYLGETLYLSAQVQSAYGGGAGAFAVGLLGAGAQWRVHPHLRVGAELLAGAAGGGGVDSGSGAVFKPMAYVGVDVGAPAYLRFGVGRIRSLNGPLDSNVFEMSLVFPYGVEARR
jgi:hypothetical protein